MIKIADENFQEFYRGYNPKTGLTVTAILDDNCVRWMSKKAGARTSARHEFGNDQKALCLKNAERALNR